MKHFLKPLLACFCSLAVLNAWSAWSATVIVNMTGSQFVPRDLTINAGDRVTWTNLDFTSHDTVSGMNGVPSGIWKSQPPFGIGGSFSFTFTNTPVGVRIPYYCTPHWRPPFNMVGSITVIVPNNPPSVSITSPTNGASFFAGDDVPIQAMLSDSDGTVVRVDFSSNGNLIGSITNPSNTVTVTLTNISEGNYSLSCVALDDRGASSAPAIVNIGVGPPVPPSITTQPTDLIVRPGTSNAFMVSVTGTPPLTYQWQFNGNDIPGATNDVYPISNIGTNDVGTYGVIVTNQVTSITSALVRLEIDFTRPTLAITSSPPNFDRRASPLITLAGMANDDIGLARVELIINGVTNNAVGTTNWSLTTDLPAGPNAILLHSVDLAGNVSFDEARFFTYVVNGTLTVRTNGQGSVTPDLNGRELEIGQVYSLKAVPNPGSIFDGWEGVANSNNASLSFVMQSNLVLTANFTNNPFATIHGTYAGLFYDHDTNVIAPESSGLFTLQVGSLGTFSGKLTINGASHSYRGQFNNQRQATLPVLRRQLTPVVLNLNFDPADTAGQVRGSVTVLVSVGITNMVDGTNSVSRTNFLRTAELLGYRNVFQSLSHPAPQAGARPFVLQRSDNMMVIGTNTATINTAGRVRFRSRFNGRKFSMATSIGENGDSPFYLSLRPGSEAIVGWLRFPANETMSYGTNLFWIGSATNDLPLRLDAVAAQP